MCQGSRTVGVMNASDNFFVTLPGHGSMGHEVSMLFTCLQRFETIESRKHHMNISPSMEDSKTR